jgi:hypothetical protein
MKFLPGQRKFDFMLAASRCAAPLDPRRSAYQRLGQMVTRVLVIDDSDYIRAMLQVRLSAEGFDVTLAIDGEDAIAKFTWRWTPYPAEVLGKKEGRFNAATHSHRGLNECM